MFYVYKITCLVNSKVYIGKTNDIKARWARHINGNDNQLIQKAIKKHGVNNFNFEIIEICDNEEQVFSKEIYHIAYYKSNICKYGDNFGYNMTDGGEGMSGGTPWNLGKKASEQARKNMSDGHKRNPSIGMGGKTHTNKTKKQMSFDRQKLTMEEATGIRQLYATDEYSCRTLSAIYDVDQKVIRDIIHNRKYIDNSELALTLASRDFYNNRGASISKAKKGKANFAGRKLTNEEVRNIKLLFVSGQYRYSDLAEQYGVGKSTIARIIKGIVYNE